MKKFKFRLAPVLREREIREKERQRELARALMDEAQNLRKLQEVQGDIRRHMELSLRERSSGTLEVDRIQNFEAYLKVLALKAQSLSLEMDQCRARTAQHRTALAVATKRRKVLDRLKENQGAAYYLEWDQKEQKVLDELGSHRAYLKHYA